MAWDFAIQGAQNTGIAAPTAAATTAPSTTNWQGQTGAGGWFDASKWDPGNFMQGVQPLSGLTYYPPHMVPGGTGDSGSDAAWTQEPGYVISSNGTKLPATQNADGTIAFSDTYDDPGGKSEKDKMDVTYILDPKSGVAIPKDAASRYQASDWVQTGQPIATVVAAMAAAYLGGTALAGASAGSGTTAGAAAAGGGAAGGGLTSAETAALYGAEGYGTTMSSGAISAYDAAIASGATAAEASAAASAADAAATGGGAATSAPAYGGPGTSGAGAGTDAVVNGTSQVTSSSTFADAAKAAGQSVMDFAKTPAGQKLIAAGVAAIASGSGGGGAAQDASNATSSQSSIAQNLPKIGTDQLAWNKQVYADGQATRDAATQTSMQAAQTQLDTAKSQSAVANDYDAYNKATLRPLEQKIVADAQNYDTAGRRADAIAGATSDVEQAYAGSNAANQRALQRSGVTTGSGRMQALMADQAIAKANSVAGASTSAVRNVENTGASRMADAAKMLNYLPAAEVAAANSSTTAGTAASGSAVTGVATQGAGVTNVNTGYTGAINANKAAGDLFGQAANESNKVAAGDAATNAAIGNAIGTYLGSSSGQQTVGDIANWISDEKVKKNTGKKASGMKALAQINATPVKDGWSYDPSKGGPNDGGKEHTGPMAQAVRRTMGDKVAPGGKSISPMDLAGKMMAGMQALSAKVAKLEKRAA
jgi:hypothetical protein